MNCQDVAKYSSLYLDNEFDPPERAEMTSHLAQCDSCRELLEAEQTFRDTLRQKLAPTEAPQHLRQRITHEIDILSQQEDARNRRDVLWGWARVVPLIAAAAVIVVLVWPPEALEQDAASAVPAVASFDPDRSVVPVRADNIGSVSARPVSYVLGANPESSAPDWSLMTTLARFQRLPTDVNGSERDVLNYMQQRIPFRLRAPLRTSPAIRLVGARQVVLQDVPAVLFVYQIRGERVSVLQRPATGSRHSTLQLQRNGALTVGVFDRRGLSNTIVSALGPAELGAVLTHQ